MPEFVCIQFVEYVLAEAEPCGVGIMRIHHLAPDLNRHCIACFLLPGDLFDLEPAGFRLKKDSSTEIERDRNLAFFEAVEILRHTDVEIKRARNLQADRGA